MKSQYVLLDANIIIEAYEMELWLTLIERVHIMVPSTVLNDEALFFKKEIGRIPEEIDLHKIVDKDLISGIADYIS